MDETSKVILPWTRMKKVHKVLTWMTGKTVGMGLSWRRVKLTLTRVKTIDRLDLGES